MRANPCICDLTNLFRLEPVPQAVLEHGLKNISRAVWSEIVIGPDLDVEVQMPAEQPLPPCCQENTGARFFDHIIILAIGYAITSSCSQVIGR